AYGSGATLRPGLSAVTVNLTNSDNTVGTLGSTSFTFNPGDYYKTTTFQPLASGSATISITEAPAGYTLPTNYQSTVYTITAPNLSMGSSYGFTIGRHMELGGYYVSLGVAPPVATTVTITSPDPTKLLLSSDGTTLGNSSISFNLNAGQTYTPQFFVQATGGPICTVTPCTAANYALSVTAAGYNPATAMITINPSGFALQGSDFATTTSSSSTTLTVVPAMLDPMYLNALQIQQLIPGSTGTQATITLSDPNTAQPSTIGDIVPSPNVIFNGVDVPNYRTSSFQPVAVGTGILRVTSPAGFSQSSNQVTVTVTSPEGQQAFGYNLSRPAQGPLR
ncbi:MAG: hypothetical protein ABSH28_19355, partial [Acidobacteriota bacterium]